MLPDTGERYLTTPLFFDIAEDMTAGVSYEYLDLGSAKLTNNFGGTFSGKYDKNYVHFIGFTLAKSF